MLRNALLLNAIFSASSGLVLIGLPHWFALQLGMPSSRPIMGMGFVLLVFAAYLALLVRKRYFGAWNVIPVIVADFGWVVMSFVLGAKFYSQFSQVGLALVAAVAVVVLLLADFQVLGLYRHRKRFVVA